jgi:cystathionine beta-lyase/cystathionine gamma-synthase
MEENFRFATRAIHAGQQPDPTTGAIMTPVYFTSTYVQSAPGVHLGHEYARVSNPTRSALEENLASLEGARFGICFASGVAAIDAIMKSLRPGDHIVASNDLYGGTYRLLRRTFEPFGYRFSFVNMTDIDAVRSAFRPETALVWVETPTNPLLRVVDIRHIVELATPRGIRVAVDNTFASPFLQRPIELGADLVMHSTTKYLGGHSDVVGGALCTSDEEWAESLRFQVKSSGASPGPMDCFLVLRGTKTLHVRMRQHCQNARRVATYLSEHGAVDRVVYPGLPSHPQHEIAARQMDDFGGMVSFTLRNDSSTAAVAFMSGTRVFSLAESLGGVESLVTHPATMTHASIPSDVRRAAGLPDSLIRLSVGIEDPDDLIDDLRRALDQPEVLS